MAHGLYHTHPVFAAALNDICTHLDPHLDHPLLPLLTQDPNTQDTTTLEEAAALLQQTRYAQPALFAFQVALHRLLTDGYHITPTTTPDTPSAKSPPPTSPASSPSPTPPPSSPNAPPSCKPCPPAP
nr:hypothetical protein [Streptomyces avermitilis]